MLHINFLMIDLGACGLGSLKFLDSCSRTGICFSRPLYVGAVTYRMLIITSSLSFTGGSNIYNTGRSV